MYTIAEVAKRLGIARSTLLYYEREGLIQPQRAGAGSYRLFSEEDVEQLVVLRQLHKAGLTLKESRQCMQGKLEAGAIKSRLAALEHDLRELLLARDLLGFMLRRIEGTEPEDSERALDIKPWHSEFERLAPEAHYRWLRQQGFSEKQALHIRWGSRNMSATEKYMRDMLEVFENAQRQGPGSDESTLRAYRALPEGFSPKRIIDMGCGAAQTSLLLADESGAQVVALDNHQPFLDRLEKIAAQRGLDGRIATQCASMMEPPFADQSFDLIWAEGSAYIIGFSNALTNWRRLLTAGGCLVVSEAVWLTDDPAPELRKFWNREYPAIKNVQARLEQAKELGYTVLDSFVMPLEDWDAFYADLEKCLAKAVEKNGASPAFDDIAEEIDIFKRYRGDFGYVFLVLQTA